jgi:Spy/CpxP family protein refolding chaperone
MRGAPWLYAAGIVVAFGLTTFASPAAAQQRQGPRQQLDPADRVEELRESLELTDEQVAQMTEVFESEADRRRELFEANRDGRDAMRGPMEALRAETDAELEKILSEEQMNAFREHRERARRRGPGRRS